MIRALVNDALDPRCQSLILVALLVSGDMFSACDDDFVWSIYSANNQGGRRVTQYSDGKSKIAVLDTGSIYHHVDEEKSAHGYAIPNSFSFTSRPTVSN